MPELFPDATADYESYRDSENASRTLREVVILAFTGRNTERYEYMRNLADVLTVENPESGRRFELVRRFSNGGFLVTVHEMAGDKVVQTAYPRPGKKQNTALVQDYASEIRDAIPVIDEAVEKRYRGDYSTWGNPYP